MRAGAGAVPSLVGRRGELREVKRLRTTTRLRTLTGSGGAGKTRLALRRGGDGPRLLRRRLCALPAFACDRKSSISGFTVVVTLVWGCLSLLPVP